MRILFLTKYPATGASSRYRVYQYLPYLRRHGVDCTVSPFYSESAYALMYLRGRLPGKILAVATGWWRRLRDAWRIRRYDVVFCQREALPFGPLWFEKRVRRLGVPLVFDYDDALFIFKPSTSTPVADKLKNPARIPRIMALSHTVFAGNDYLRRQAASYCADARTVLVAEDTDRFSPPGQYENRATVVAGWLGSPSTEKYLEIIRRPLEQLARRLEAEGRRLELHIMGGGRFTSPAFTVRHLPWSLEAETAQLPRWDMGLMPLPDEEWSQGKSGGKARTYMAAGVPAVVADIGFNRQLIAHGCTGFLCAGEAQWLTTMLAVACDARLRWRVAQAARAEVESRHSLKVLAPVFLAHLRDVRARYGPQLEDDR